nr:MerR family transcriptional regulator [Streptomyces clavuligerus]
MGLARPSLRTAAGYRLYTAGDLERLHRIAVYRETGSRPGQIRAVLDGRPRMCRGRCARSAPQVARTDRPPPAARAPDWTG